MFEELIKKFGDKRKIPIENIYFIRIGRVDIETRRFTFKGEYSFAKCEINKDGYPEFTDVFYPRQYYLYNHVWNNRGIRCCKKVISLKKWLQDSNSASTKKILMDGWIYY